jgi:hypothetical protein
MNKACSNNDLIYTTNHIIYSTELPKSKPKPKQHAAFTQTLSHACTQTSPALRIPKTDAFDFSTQTASSIETQTMDFTPASPPLPIPIPIPKTTATAVAQTTFPHHDALGSKNTAVQTNPIMHSAAVQTLPVTHAVDTDTSDLPPSPRSQRSYIMQVGMILFYSILFIMENQHS